MSDKNKTSLEEAKANFEEIKKFATDAAKQEFEAKLNEKVDKIIKESLSVEVDDEDNVTIIKDDKVVEMTNDGEVEIEDVEKHEEEIASDDGEDYHEDEEEIEIEKNIDEMINFEEQEQTTAPVEPVAPAPIEEPVAPMEEVPEDNTQIEPASNEGASELDPEIIDLAKSLDRVIKKATGGENNIEGQGVEVDYVDDEANIETPAPAAEQPASVEEPAQPVQEEDEILEFSLEEIDECGVNEEEMIEIEVPEIEDEMEFDLGDLDDDEDYVEIDTDDDFNGIFEIEDDLEEVKMMGQSNSVQKGTAVSAGPENAVKNRGRQNGEDNVPYERLEESKNKNKAQYESKMDELIKENKSLKKSNKEFKELIENYQDSFADLKKQFNEMQVFNAKLAYANKVFASGGLTTSEKTKIAEEFDRVKTADDAKKLYNRIIKENKISINSDSSSKIKTITTNTVKSKDVVYESQEMKRRKVLAGIEKNEDYL